MSKLEKKARLSIALSNLNSFRHVLQERENSVLREDVVEFIEEAMDISMAKELTKNMLMYSFHSCGDYDKSSALQLGKAFKEVPDFLSHITTLKRYLSTKNKELQEELIQFVEDTMDVLSWQTERVSC